VLFHGQIFFIDLEAMFYFHIRISVVPYLGVV
jgi:hypothetical protein